MVQEGLDPSTLSGYLRKHQVEEAEHIIISKIDMVTREVLLKLVEAVKSYNPEAGVIPYSAITGHGVEKIMAVIRSGVKSDRKPVDIDYDTYAKAEAELGWYNGTFGFQTMEKVDAYELATKIDQGHIVLLRTGGHSPREADAHLRHELPEDVRGVRQHLGGRGQRLPLFRGKGERHHKRQDRSRPRRC